MGDPKPLGFLQATHFCLCAILFYLLPIETLAGISNPAMESSSYQGGMLIHLADQKQHKDAHHYEGVYSFERISNGKKNKRQAQKIETETLKGASQIDPDSLRAIVNPFNSNCYDWFGNVMPCDFKGPYAELMFNRPSPVPRFVDNKDGSVTDHFTDLIWLKNANCFGIRDWFHAKEVVKNLKDGYRGPDGEVVLSDGSSSGQWRLPTIEELAGLMDFSHREPALPKGHKFSGIPQGYFWSSTTLDAYSGLAWVAFIHVGGICYNETNHCAGYVWPVRDPQK